MSVRRFSNLSVRNSPHVPYIIPAVKHRRTPDPMRIEIPKRMMETTVLETL